MLIERIGGPTSKLETAMSGWDETRLRAKAKQDEILRCQTWKIGELAGPLKDELAL